MRELSLFKLGQLFHPGVALLFTQQLSAIAMSTLEQWFGADVIEPLPL